MIVWLTLLIVDLLIGALVISDWCLVGVSSVLSRRKHGRGRSGHDRVETESAGRSRSSGWVMTAGAGDV